MDDMADKNYRFHVGVDLSYVASKSHAEATDADYTAAVLVAVDASRERAYVLDVHRERGMTLRQSIQWLGKIAGRVPDPTIKVEEVGAQSWWIQEAEQQLSGHIVPVSPGTTSKESRIQDMSILFERGDVVLANNKIDDNLGYDPRFRPFVREWLEFGNGNSPDLLDATYYALQDLQLGQSTRVAGVSGDMYGNRR
jgi:phage terminase large subunit-like protein